MSLKVVLVLAWVGGGSSFNGDIAWAFTPNADACTQSKWSWPSQTLEGSGSMTIHNSGGKLGNVTVPPSNSTVQQKRFQSTDFENLNMVSRIFQNSTGPAVYQIEVDTILNWKAGLVTQHLKQNASQCKTTKLPNALRLLPIPFIVQKLKDVLMSMYKCVGHVDGLDTFEFKLTDFPPKFITGKSPFLNMTIDAQVDAAGLLKSSSVLQALTMDVSFTFDGKTETMTEHTLMKEDTTYTKSQAGGPSEQDLKIPEEWGNCSTVHTPQLEDLLAEWEGSDSPFLGHARLIPHMLRAMVSEATSMLVV